MPVTLLCGCSSLLPFAGVSSSLSVAALVVIIVAGLIFAALEKKAVPKLNQLLPDNRFDEQHITHTFIAAIPMQTREMNLEVAVAKQTEVFEKTDSKKVWGIDLGTNTVRITVPVTYRYHVCLYGRWQMHTGAGSIGWIAFKAD